MRARKVVYQVGRSKRETHYFFFSGLRKSGALNASTPRRRLDGAHDTRTWYMYYLKNQVLKMVRFLNTKIRTAPQRRFLRKEKMCRGSVQHRKP